jgi:anti-sigma-K factor RskA
MSETAEDPTVTAGEYVLGLLDSAEMRQVEDRAVNDQVLAREIAFWEDNLAPLAALVRPVPPSPVLWSRLALATGIGGREPRRANGSPRFWQGTTAAAVAIAACFAYIAFLPHPPTADIAGSQFVAALGPSNGTTPFLAQTRADGSIAITRLAAARPAANGRSYQLWALPSGATTPISLGVIPAGSSIVRPADRPSVNEQLLVSDEPAGGSPTGLPTGAVLWAGTLTPILPALPNP